MNQFMQEQWSWVDGLHKMRTSLLDELTDGDLSYNPGGQNSALGVIFREMGDVEHSYVESLKTFKQDWSYHNTEPEIETSVSKLKTWFEALDNDMQATVSDFSDEDLKKPVDRGFPIPAEIQLVVYQQALFIFFGKVTVYFKTMGKTLPKQVQDWIG